MFGGQNTITSSWGQPQQTQPQQGTSTFGQPANPGAFGSGSAFGSGGAFGQQQQQQPQANPMFGGLGGTPSNTAAPASGFGAFGSTNQANTGSSLFGQPKPATGFGAFSGGGGTGAFGGGSTFGGGTPGTSTGTGVFGGGQQSTTGAFGAFGAKPATQGTFGTTTANATTGTYDNVPPVTTGSSNPPYSVFTDKDNNVNYQYQSITCIPAYRGTSFEELRLQDYVQNRKTAGSFTQPVAQTGTGLFGQQQANAPAQPSNSVFGSFGNAAASTSNNTGAFGTFGQPAAGTSNTAQPAGGVFGGSTFGSQQQPQQGSAFGTFGQQQQPQQPQQQQAGAGSLFGGGGAFGAGQQQKPFGAFGATNTGTGAFGGGVGAFGAQQQQQQQGAATGGGLFGQQSTQPQQSNNAFGPFGGNNAAKPSIFGQSAQPAGAFNAFGQTQPQGQQPQGTQTGSLFGTGTGGGLFGQQQQQAQQPGSTQPGSLFGTQSAQQQPQQPNSNLFGGNTAGGGGLFGNNANQTAGQQQQTGQTGGFGLFGTKPAAPAAPTTGGSLFGTGAFGQTSNTGTAAPAQQSNLFGTLGQSSNTQPASNAFGGSLFAKPAASAGTQPAQPIGGLFGTTPGASLFGNTMGGNNALGQSAAQPQLTASIAQPISANLPIFSMLPPGPRAVNLDQPKKKASLFVDVPTRSPVPRLGLGYSPASSRLRGFTSTAMIPGTDGRPLGPAVSLTVGKPGVLSLSRAAANRSLLGPDSFLGSVSGPSPGLGSGSRSSVKKLVLDKKIEPSDLFSKSSLPKVTFNPALSIAARELEAATASAAAPPAPETLAPKTTKTSNRFSASGEQSKDAVEKEPELQEGDYYVRPSLGELKKRGFKELAETEGLVVGRVGYGEIEFLDKVDITGLTKTSSLLGDFVRFDDKECAVYPDCDEADKPPPGSGLNVRARITLLHCWPVDKATREPIQDEKHPAMVKHLKRLKAMKNTHFENYDIDTGKWIFTVDHF